MAWPKGKGRRAAGSGRKKGVQNHLTTALKDLILQALANAGGVDYLTQQAKDNPGVFLTLVGKVLPLQVKQDGAEPRLPAAVNHIHEHVDS
jgi:hypothetical protein